MAANDGWVATAYHLSAQEHVTGDSTDNLLAMSASPQRATDQQQQQQVGTPLRRVEQPSPGANKPLRSEAPPSPGSEGGGAGSSGERGASLDQFAPMLPTNPIQQLPLLHTETCTAATVRVAAWLLDQQPPPAGLNHLAAGGAATSGMGSAHSLSIMGTEDDEEEGNGMDDIPDEAAAMAAGAAAAASTSGAAAAGAAAGPAAGTAAAVRPWSASAAARGRRHRPASDCDGYRPTDYYCDARRRSLDAFMSRPVQHGDKLNNYVAALY